ncbi:hypothetical protein COLO4_11063 [Corchorus olitorius]|uniref:alpha-L-fucosidase n=1 Tax=Corchorus olitorius TaxID=93759 RepID=A0A1R3K5W7_9ROSI|nr:hypothetical protein COLO4_11063 [Corchorus olitorius]
MSLFFHFGPNTFTDSEWGTGHANPSVFNPTRLNASQWVNVAKEAGFSRVILTTKHHDGFCLWPSEYTDYSVKSSSWRNGNGDVVGELAMAAKEAGTALGLYLSPWDRHESCYGKTVDYNKFYLGQMVELLTRYGDIEEVFLDSARGETDMEYYFDTWFSLIHQLQPGAAIFSNFGPDTRWVGNEAGFAASTCWSLFNRSRAEIGGFNSLYSQQGDPHGPDWIPAECDVSIRPGWFWHSSEVPKSALQLLDIYYLSAGQNCHLLLNVPPNSSGLISDEDIQVLQEFKKLRTSIFATNLAKNARLNASSIRGGNDNPEFSPYNVLEEGIYTYWAPQEDQFDWILYIDLQESMSFNVLQVQEPIQMGQRIIEFHLESLHGGKWKKVINGTTVGYKRLLKFPTVESQYLKFVVDKSRADPLICYLGIHMDRFSVTSFVSNTTSQAHVNGGQFLQQVVYNYSQIVGMK